MEHVVLFFIKGQQQKQKKNNWRHLDDNKKNDSEEEEEEWKGGHFPMFFFFAFSGFWDRFLLLCGFLRKHPGSRELVFCFSWICFFSWFFTDWDPMGWKSPSFATIWENLFWVIFLFCQKRQANPKFFVWSLSTVIGCVNYTCQDNWVVVSNIVYFHSYLGKWSNLTSIFFNWVETTN